MNKQVKLILIFLMMSTALFGAMGDVFDINSASDEDLALLPISEELLESLLDYRISYGDFESVYDLLKIPGISYEEFLLLKSKVAVYPEYLTLSQKNIEDNYYKFEQMAFSDGTSEGLVDMWIDLLSNPRNINTLSYDELSNLPGMTLKDVKAVMAHMEQGNTISSARELRNIEGLSHYAYSNLSDYVTYDSKDAQKWTGQYSYIVKNAQLTIVPDDDPESISIFQSHTYPLDIYHKLRLTYDQNIDFGLSYARSMGEDDEYYSVGSLQIPRVKAFISKEFKKNRSFGIKELTFGNYVASFGQGVVMESVGYSTPRKSGYGFSKRLTGIEGDLSRNLAYSLKGAAAELYAGNVIFTPFLSSETRDAVINNDGSFTAIIRMAPRFEYGLSENLQNSLLRQVREVLYGSNVRYVYKNTAHIGMTFYESLYDRVLDPQIESVVAAANLSKYLYSIGNAADSEIEAMYASEGESGLWSEAKAFRRVFGIDGSWVVKNVTLRGELGILDSDGDSGPTKNDPKAFVMDAYWQFESLNIYMLYRDYDLAYDNPYQRSFSNYQRYKSTIFEDSYYLEDAAYAFLYTGTAQPQSEKGFYYSLRYQLNRQLIIQGEHDIWTRVSDQSHYNRLVVRLDYRPVFNYRIRLRQKFQTRAAEDIYSPTGYTSNETRLDVQMRMSRFNSLNLLFAYGFTAFDSRARLTDNAYTGGTSLVGSAGSPGRAIAAKLTHNFNKRLKLISQFMIYDGFIWNFEDTDFRVYNTLTQSFHGYVALYSRLNRNLSVRVKYSFDDPLPLDNVVNGIVTTEAGTYEIEPIVFPKSTHDFRIQLDYHF